MKGVLPEVQDYISQMWLRTGYTFEVMAIRVNAIYGTELKADDIQNIIYTQMNKSEEEQYGYYGE